MKRRLDLAVFTQVTARGFTASCRHHLRAGPQHYFPSTEKALGRARQWLPLLRRADGTGPMSAWSSPRYRGLRFPAPVLFVLLSFHLESLLPCSPFSLPHTPTARFKRSLLRSGGGNRAGAQAGSVSRARGSAGASRERGLDPAQWDSR